MPWPPVLEKPAMIPVLERKLPEISGVLDPQETLRYLSIRQFTTEDPDALPWLTHIWCVKWDMPKGQSFAQQTLPSPSFNLVSDSSRGCALFGCASACFTYPLQGKGRVIGIRLRPAAQVAFWSGTAASLTDSALPAGTLLPPALAERLARLSSAEICTDNLAETLQDLAAVAAPLPPRALEMAQIIQTVEQDNNLFQVAQLAERCGLSARSLQRLFRTYVGLSPKLVLERSRMQDAVRALHLSDAALADLAQRLGYFDQAHFANAFRALTGSSPGAYLDRNRGG